jgi:hypothetical protein
MNVYDQLLKKISSESMTAGQIIELLRKYPKDMMVFTTFGSCVRSIKSSHFYENRDGKLFIDADLNRYKESFAKDPTENEEND